MTPIGSPIGFYGNCLVCPVRQTVSGQGLRVILAAGAVIPPVFEDSIGLVAIAFEPYVVAAGGGRCHFQHEMGRFPLVVYGITVLGKDLFDINAKGDGQVRYQDTCRWVGLCPKGTSLRTRLVSGEPKWRLRVVK